MAKYILKRLLLLIPVVLCVALLIFVIMSFTPGDPAVIILGENATPEQVANLHEKLGLDDPLPVRFFNYIKGIVTRFDFGTSYTNGREVKQEILQRFGFTLKIASFSMVFSLGIGIPLGIVAALNRNSWKDNLSMTVALFGISMPTFWFGLMLSIIFALKLRWLPPSGVGSIKNYIMPCLAGHPRRLHHHRPGQGPDRAGHHLPPCPAQRPDPRGHPGGRHLRPADVRNPGGGDRVHHSRPGDLYGHRHQVPGLPRHSGRGHYGVHRVQYCDAPGRFALCRR